MSWAGTWGGGAGSPTGGDKAPDLLHCAQVSKLVERRVRACDVGVDLGSYLVLPYQIVAVMHFAVEARALKVLRISFF